MEQLISLDGADLFLFYDEDDRATIKHQLADPRAKIISPREANPTWRKRPVRIDHAWSGKMQGIFSLAAIHFWRNNIDFDYLDIGASVGMTTIAQAVFFGRCGRDNHTFAFEPGPVFDLLSRSIVASDVADMVTCVRAAVGEKPGRAKFYLTPDKSTSSSLSHVAVSRPGINDRVETEVEVITLDGFAERLRPAQGLIAKIDAEGCDLQVLAGATQTLESRLTVFQIEIFPSIMGHGAVARALADLSKRYVMIEVGGGYRHFVYGAAASQFLDDVASRKPIPATDLLAIDKRIPNLDKIVDKILSG